MISGSTTPQQINGRGSGHLLPTPPIRKAITARKEQELGPRSQVGVRQLCYGLIHPATFGFSGDSDSIRRGLAMRALPLHGPSLTTSWSSILRTSTGHGY